MGWCDVTESAANPAVPVFALRDVTVGFGKKAVLSVRDLCLWPGEVTVVRGENGSGKTTLLRLLNGLVPPSSGTVEFRGRPLDAPGPGQLRRDCVLAHQACLLFSGSVYFNVSYPLKVRGIPRAEHPRRVAQALGQVGLSGYDHRRAAALSGGEKQRVALARALAADTSVLLLDEPTAHVDIEARSLVEKVVRNAAHRGMTVVMTSHDRELAYRSADRLLDLDAGEIFPAKENLFRGKSSPATTSSYILRPARCSCRRRRRPATLLSPCLLSTT